MVMEKMVVPFEIKSINEEDPNFFMFEGYASTFGNIDDGLDRVKAGAFAKTIAAWNASRKKLPVLWQHDTAMPIGVYPSLTEDQKGLFVKGCLPKSDTFVSGRVIPQMKCGSISDMSIGYIAQKYSFAEGGMVRDLEEIDLKEVSLVTMPMNSEANVTGFKSVGKVQDLPMAPLDYVWEPKAAEARVREFTGAQEAPTEALKSAYLYADLEALDEFDSYKFLITDVIEGKLHLVFQAVQAASAAIQADYKVPTESAEGLKSTISRYYKKFSKPSPYAEKACIRIESIELLTERELERLFKKGVFFTDAQAKKLVKSIVSSRREESGDTARDAGIKEIQKLLSEFKTFNEASR